MADPGEGVACHKYMNNAGPQICFCLTTDHNVESVSLPASMTLPPVIVMFLLKPSSSLPLSHYSSKNFSLFLHQKCRTGNHQRKHRRARKHERASFLLHQLAAKNSYSLCHQTQPFPNTNFVTTQSSTYPPTLSLSRRRSNQSIRPKKQCSKTRLRIENLPSIDYRPPKRLDSTSTTRRIRARPSNTNTISVYTQTKARYPK